MTTTKNPPAKRGTARKVTRKPVKTKRPLTARERRGPHVWKSKAIELCLVALAGGWTLRKFALWARIGRGTIIRWMGEETVQDRFHQAMRTKALLLPDEAMEIVHVLRRGGEWRVLTDPTTGKAATEWVKADSKALGTALRHIEFRMMREIKHYRNTRDVNVNLNDMSAVPDDKLENRYEELLDRAQQARQIGGKGSPSGEARKNEA